MSARLAWHRPLFRVLIIALVLFAIIVNAIFLVKVTPVAKAASTIIFHYNVYLGIDDVRTWTWVFVWPALWLGAVASGVVTAFGVYQRDSLLAYGLLTWLLAWSVPWSMGLFYLMTFNVR